MEDEQGDVAQGDIIDGVSSLPSSEKFATDPLLENMGGENEFLEEGIMIDVVGSDVFVNGISGEKGGSCLGSEDAVDLKGHGCKNPEEIETRNLFEAMDGIQQGETEAGFVGSGDELDCGVINEDKEVENEGEAGNKSGANICKSEVSSGEIGKAEKEGAIAPNGDTSNSDHLGEDSVMYGGVEDDKGSANCIISDVLRCEIGKAEKEGVTLSNENRVNSGDELDCGVINEDKEVENEGEAGNKSGANICKSEVSSGEIGKAEKEGAIAPNGDTSNSDHLGEDSVMYGGVEDDKGSANCVISDVLRCEIGKGEKEGVILSNENRVSSDHMGDDSVTPLEAVSLSDGALVDDTKGEFSVNRRPKDGVFEAKIVNDLAADIEDSDLKREPIIPHDHEGDITEIKKDNASTENIHLSKPMDTEYKRECVEKHNDGEKTVVDLKVPELETEEPTSENDSLTSANLLSKSNFVISDLVWGKVRSHPWWPGQIFNPSNASEETAKRHKKGSFLVAYFGDNTFAWNDESTLKPFESHFSEMVRQSNSDLFQMAVSSALEEVSRRAELGLYCSCVPRDVYGEIESQFIEKGVDLSSQASNFKPDKFFNCVRNLASCEFSDRMNLVITRAQLSAFFRFKRYPSFIEFSSFGEIPEDDVGSGKKKTPDQTQKIVYSRRKRSPLGFAGEGVSSVKKRKKSLTPQAGRANRRAAKVSNMKSQIQTKPLFKIGECIRRAASRMTGPTTSVKVNSSNDEFVTNDSQEIYKPLEKNQSVFVIDESFSTDEMLLEHDLTAQKPEKADAFQNDTHTFFMEFGSSNEAAPEKKGEPKVVGFGEEFEFDDANESHLGSEEQSRPRKRFCKQLASVKLEDEESVKKKQELSPAELILKFDERKCIPTEIKLNKMLRRFGPLMESETEVDHDSGRARVIFKRGCDANVALNSAEKFSIFGPGLVDYQIGYNPLISVKIEPLAVPQCMEDETLII